MGRTIGHFGSFEKVEILLHNSISVDLCFLLTSCVVDSSLNISLHTSNRHYKNCYPDRLLAGIPNQKH